jgi:hypothetical protein
MSLSETFNHGAVIPWANMRFNNVNIDGDITNDSFYTHNVGPVTFTDTAVHILYSLTMPTTTNAVYCFETTVLVKGGVPPATNKSFYQQYTTITQITGGVSTSAMVSNINAGIIYTTGETGVNNTLVGNVVNFGVYSTIVGDTTEYTWSLKIFSINPSI